MNADYKALTHSDINDLPKNILELKVFYKTLNTERIVQEPRYTVS